MGIVLFLIVGGVIGWLASLIMGTDGQQGLIANIVVGILGCGLGGWLAPKLGIKAEKPAAAWAVAIGGAVLLIVILRVLGIF
ncbi:MAG: GlsB/YeaQ/YmgE family stress response membrane protein [Planctomycetota bacterium]